MIVHPSIYERGRRLPPQTESHPRALVSIRQTLRRAQRALFESLPTPRSQNHHDGLQFPTRRAYRIFAARTAMVTFIQHFGSKLNRGHRARRYRPHPRLSQPTRHGSTGLDGELNSSSMVPANGGPLPPP